MRRYFIIVDGWEKVWEQKNCLSHQIKWNLYLNLNGDKLESAEEEYWWIKQSSWTDNQNKTKKAHLKSPISTRINQTVKALLS